MNIRNGFFDTLKDGLRQSHQKLGTFLLKKLVRMIEIENVANQNRFRED